LFPASRAETKAETDLARIARHRLKQAMQTQILFKYTASPNHRVAIAAFKDWIAAGKPDAGSDEFRKRGEKGVRQPELSIEGHASIDENRSKTQAKQEVQP
jgi:hypothetical protein